MLRFYVSIDLGNGCVFGCTLVLISLEYTLGWNATVSTVITSDMWQRGHYSRYRMCSWLWPADGRLPRQRRPPAGTHDMSGEQTPVLRGTECASSVKQFYGFLLVEY